MSTDTPKPKRPNAAFVSLGVSAGCGLGAIVGTLTDNWTWMPMILSVCIGLGAFATWWTTAQE